MLRIAPHPQRHPVNLAYDRRLVLVKRVSLASILGMSLDQHEIEGYRICSCGALVLEAAADMQAGRCADCWSEHISALKVVEVIHRGQRTCLPARPVKDKTGSRGSKCKAKAVERAKLEALRALRDLYPAMYDMLYDQARARRGLQPITRINHAPHDVTAATYDFDPVYAALAQVEGSP